MHLSRSKASYEADRLKALYKRIEAVEKKMDEASDEEAAQSNHQQECILSGGVYSRHRLEKADSLEGYVCLSAFSPVRV